MLNAHTLHKTRCAMCAFLPPESDVQSSYALVLASKYKTTLQAWSNVDSFSGSTVIVNKTAYCDKCQRVTWITRESDVQQALVNWFN